MPLDKRPYIGTWKLNNQELVQHTPDALVYLNGDLTLPGCTKCRGRIDIQKFITEVSVDAGTEAGSASATFSLAIPLHHTDSFARDAKFILRPGLEVNIYMRGYFPVMGLFSALAEPTAATGIQGASTVPRKPVTDEDPVISKDVPEVVADGFRRMKLKTDQQENAALIYNMLTEAGYTPAAAVAAIVQSYGESGLHNVKQKGGPGLGLFQLDPGGLGKESRVFEVGKVAGTADTATTYNALDPETNIKRIIAAIPSSSPASKVSVNEGKSPSQNFTAFYGSSLGLGNRNPKELPWRNKTVQYTRPQWEAKWDGGHEKRQKRGKAWFGAAWEDPNFSATVAAAEKAKAAAAVASLQTPGVQNAGQETEAPPKTSSGEIVQGEFGPSFLEAMGLDGLGIEDTMAYPYYHVFHGVVTSTNINWAGGVSSIQVTCNSMLHFWQYHNMSTNASVFGARPTNSKNKMSLVGNNFTGMHPYAIMYKLHYDTAGAAGSVGFALSDKSNQKAKTYSGETLFSLNLRYWEKRFAQGTRLRMHGATGELFTTMAAAWLSRKSAGAMTRALRDRYKDPKDFGTKTNIGSQMTAVGLYSGPNVRSALEATKFADKSKPTEQAKFEINILEMQAFVSNIGDWGNINLFESSYESKLDVAQKVCGITGFEFYQDVDGDFVFKPPMWNLDTSSSRVYRLEDIDLINIAFSEKEPQVTYMTVKGSAFQNLLGTGTENEWGVRGQFLDYRLIAQFGWRPGTYETNYFNDPKSMFFAAVNRMDVMNIGVNSASVTIPIRPELRPGYPVYIPYLDCYYYCSSFAHSHSVGGQCTTALQLVGKRSKFYAPGTPSREGEQTKQGISSIDLGDTLLPERPLEVRDPSGKPRLSGFPNVIMALDPTKVNPLFYIVGTDIENIADMRVIKDLLRMASSNEFGIIKEVSSEGTATYYTYTRVIPGIAPETTGRSEDIPFFLDTGNESGPVEKAKKKGPKGKKADSEGPINILFAAREYSQLLKAGIKKGADSKQKIDAVHRDINNLQNQYAAAHNNPKRQGDGKEAAQLEKTMAELTKKIQAAQDKLSALQGQLAEAKGKLEAEWEDFDQHPAVALLLNILSETMWAYRSQADFQGRSDLSSTVNLLDMLSDKKATFSNGQQPGQYRYYSASHPNPVQQGPRQSKYENKHLETLSPAELTRTPPDTVPTVMMYTKNPQGGPGEIPPEAQLVPGTPQVGIRVLTSKPGHPKGEVYATSEVMELMFTVQDVTLLKNVTTHGNLAHVSGVGPAVTAKVNELLKPSAEPATNRAFAATFKDAWDNVAGRAEAGVVAMKAAASDGSKTKSIFLKAKSSFPMPTTVTVGTKSVTLSHEIGMYKYAGNADGKVDLGVTITKKPLAALVGKVQAALAKNMLKQVATALKACDSAEMKADQAKRDAAVSAFNNGFTVGAASKAKSKGATTTKVYKGETTYSPVFPVSDAQGYHVLGSYRYGRGVSIDPEGVFAQLHKHDIFSLLDKNLVDQILKFYVEHGNIGVPTYETKMKKGKTVTVPVTTKGTAANRADQAKYLNDEALRQLRSKNLTDKQILDYSAAINKGSETSQLDFDLANLFVNSESAIQKIPLVNAAFSLADLNPQPTGHICNCKAAEASMQLEAFGQTGFIPVGASGAKTQEGYGTSPDDAVTRWVRAGSEVAAAQWDLQQQALRGQMLDKGSSGVVSQFLGTLGIDSVAQGEQDSFIAQGRDATEAQKQALLKAYAAARTAKNKLKKGEEK